MELIWLMLVGVATGWLASKYGGTGGLGPGGDMVLGLIGAIIGGILIGGAILPPKSRIGRTFAAFLSAAVLIFLLRLLKRDPGPH